MSGITTFGADAWLRALFGVDALPGEYFIALCGSEPGQDDDGDTLALFEPDPGAGYDRISYAADGSHWDSDGQYLFTTADISFGVPSADWGILPYYALCSALTSGDLYAWGNFDNPQNAPTGFAVTITAGGIVLSLASLDAIIAL